MNHVSARSVQLTSQRGSGQEIHAKLLEVQDFLTSNLDWAAAQATQSRARADAETPAHLTAPTPAATLSPAEAEAAANVRLASNNPFAAVLSGDAPLPPTTTTATNGKATTEEEDILSEMLSATTEVSLSSFPLAALPRT